MQLEALDTSLTGAPDDCVTSLLEEARMVRWLESQGRRVLTVARVVLHRQRLLAGAPGGGRGSEAAGRLGARGHTGQGAPPGRAHRDLRRRCHAGARFAVRDRHAVRPPSSTGGTGRHTAARQRAGDGIVPAGAGRRAEHRLQHARAWRARSAWGSRSLAPPIPSVSGRVPPSTRTAPGPRCCRRKGSATASPRCSKRGTSIACGPSPIRTVCYGSRSATRPTRRTI